MVTPTASSTAPSTAPLVYKDLISSGIRPSCIRTQLRRKMWIRMHDGIYLDARLIGAERREAKWRCHLAAAGAGSALSYLTAAELHGFDSTDAYDTTAPTAISVVHAWSSRASEGRSLNRTRRLRQDDLSEIRGLPVTSRARTVLDLASVLATTELDRVVESALRGPNSRRPDRWRESVLVELSGFAGGDHRIPGASRLAEVLRLRPEGCRPTGSIAETAMLQAIHRCGVDAIRQPTIRVVQDDGTWNEYFPDLLVERRRVIVEVDGAQHRDSARHRADLARQNFLLRGFHLVRCTGADALFDSDRIAREVASYPVVEPPAGPYSWSAGGRTVTGDGLFWTVQSTKRKN
jgi:very-short-patch-repair endonuclease